MARKVRGAGGISEVTLPGGWVLAEGDIVVISDAEWEIIFANPDLSLRVDDLGTTTDPVATVPSWRDIQRQTSGGSTGLEAQINTVSADLAEHEVQTFDVHGIPDTSDIAKDDIPSLTLIFENGLV